MKTPFRVSHRAPCRAFVLSLTCLAALSFALPISLRAADAPAAPSAKKAETVPVKAKFEKAKDGESGPYHAVLKNDSKTSLTLHGKVLLSVYYHADTKARSLPDKVLKAGEEWTIPELAKNDKIVLTAEGYAPLELTVP